MVQKIHFLHGRSLILGSFSLFVLVLSLLGCSVSSQQPVKFDDYATLKGDCSSLLSNHQTASISGALNLRESTLCITDQDGERCEILLGNEGIGLDLWMKTGGKNGMEDLPDPYRPFDLVVTADDGGILAYNDMVTTTLLPFFDKEDENEACSFRVLTILRSKIIAAENQPGEGTVNLAIPANVLWFDTGIYVNQGQHIMLIPGYGSYNLQDNNPNWNAISFGMNGISEKICDNNCVINGQNYGMLVAKINEGQPFVVTSSTSDFIIAASGELYLAVNDCVDCYANNSGNFDIIIDLHNAP